MKPWEILDKAESPGGSSLVLARRGAEFSIRVDGRELMTSRASNSERELGHRALETLDVQAPRVLVGGLGMGFTLRAALDALGTGARVDVVELSPAVVRWNRSWLRDLCGAPLDDARVTVIERDVARVIEASTATYDALLLDVDNGPEALSAASNAALYGTAGLRAAAKALAPRGVLAVWSASDDRRFVARLEAAGFDVDVRRPFGHGQGGRRHVLYLAARGAVTRVRHPLISRRRVSSRRRGD